MMQWKIKEYARMKNIDVKTVQGFGREWKQFDQTNLSNKELQRVFNSYFKIFPFESLNSNSVGMDVGCGSGRWAKFIAPKVHTLYCIDASEEALTVARKNLKGQENVEFIHASVDKIPLQNHSMDFAYSLGVLHHIPDTLEGIKTCSKKLKKGAPFLVYLYYRFDNKPRWFRTIWQISDFFRQFISKLPFTIKLFCTQIIAAFIYYPFARFALLMEKLKFNVDNYPLSAYRKNSFYTMRTDSLDRFGTRLEHRFTQKEIISMFKDSGFTNIQISTDIPYWCAIGFKE